MSEEIKPIAVSEDMEEELNAVQLLQKELMKSFGIPVELLAPEKNPHETIAKFEREQYENRMRERFK